MLGPVWQEGFGVNADRIQIVSCKQMRAFTGFEEDDAIAIPES